MAKKTLGYLELHWNCPHCGTQNEGGVQSCISCGSPQPEEAAFVQQPASELLEDAEKIHAAQQAPDIHCPYCGTRNPAKSVECRQCGGDLEDGARRVNGRILGAYSSQDTADDIQCPSCQQPNNSLAAFCVHCGSPLQTKKQPLSSPETAPAVPIKTSPKKFPRILMVLLVLISVACVAGILIALLSGGGQNEPLKGTVTDLYWERSIAILEQQTVTRENWQEQIPAGDRLVSCEDRYYRTQDNPAPGAVEVCGTPYTVDLGNGFAEVVQDCEYEVYKAYCSYETLDWVVIETLQTSGSDQYADWADYNLNANQKTGDQTEQYTITLYADGQNFQYSTRDYTFFQQVDYGSEWWIETGLFGGIKSITPVD